MHQSANHLIDALTGNAAPERRFAACPGASDVSYGALFGGARRMAAALVQMGVRPGDRVAAQVGKSLEALQLYLATVMAGGVFLPLNPAYVPREVGYFLNDASPRIFVCDPAAATALSPVATAAGTAHLMTLGTDGGGTLMAAAADFDDSFVPVPRGPGDLAAILYTSGTTGRSKGAMLSHAALVSNSATLREVWRFGVQDVLIHALPIFHTHGLFVATNIALMAGCSLIFLPTFDAGAVLDAMRNATALMGVPTFYTRLLEQKGLTREATANMRLFVSGSAPLLAVTHRDWTARTGHAILERYGMTETNMNTSNPYEGERRPGTVGFPLPGVEVKIRDPETGAEVVKGDIGVIEVRGPNVFAGYWRMAEKTAEELRPDGWFITGDLGQIDPDGYVLIVGRAKDLVITGGLNVYPREVEELIDALPGVLESAVIGVAHPDLGEAVVAVVVPASTGLEAVAIRAGLVGKLARFKQPKHVALVDALPRNTMGKVQKAALRQRFAGLFIA